MLPGGFKKDSRVWLHKNAHVFPKKTVVTDGYNGQRIGSDDPYDQCPVDPYINPSPFITDANGRVFKKDSRTWLHKSSVKKLARTVTNGAIRMATTGGKAGWRQQPRSNVNFSGGEAVDGLIRTRSSTEMIRAQTGAFKVKKKKKSGCHADGTLGTTLDSRSVKELNTRSHVKQPGASYHSMTITKKGSCEVSAYASDFCIVGKDSPGKIAISSSSETENEDDDDDDNEQDSCRRNGYGKCDRGSMVNYSLCCLDDGGRACIGLGYNNSTVEITKDGLRELERMMKEQSRKRCERFASNLLHDATVGVTHAVSPETVSSESKASLEACIDLSEEMGKEAYQSQNSADQLTQATEYLHVCSPNHPAPTLDMRRPPGDM